MEGGNDTPVLILKLEEQTLPRLIVLIIALVGLFMFPPYVLSNILGQVMLLLLPVRQVEDMP